MMMMMKMIDDVGMQVGLGELKVKTCSAGPLCLDLDAKYAV